MPMNDKPRRATTRTAKAVWWWADPSGVDVYTMSEENSTLQARIGWYALLRAAQRYSGYEVIVRKVKR